MIEVVRQKDTGIAMIVGSTSYSSSSGCQVDGWMDGKDIAPILRPTLALVLSRVQEREREREREKGVRDNS